MSEFAKGWRPSAGLTEREMQVLNEIHSGKSLREVSQSLTISQNTVKNHVRNIIEKLKLFHGGMAE